MSIEDRVRTATRARTDLVRDIRPLEFPDELPAPIRRSRPTARRWINWGAPIAAAALVTALALTLSLLRQADGTQPVALTPTASSSEAGSSSSSSSSAAIPRYYVALADAGNSNSQLKAVVGDDQTGRTVAVLNPSASQNFYGVTAAADDRTFVVMNYTAATQQTTWYRLRIAPGTAHPAQLTKLPIKPVTAHVAGLALSPDGRELAVMWRTATTQTNAVTYLAVYSMASGAALHTWVTKGDNINAIAGGGNGEALAWVNGDQSVDFRWIVTTGEPHPSSTHTIRRVDVAAPGGDLLADSRVAVRFPPDAEPTKSIASVPCGTSVTANDGTVACGTVSFSDVSFEEVCSTVPPSFVTYSATTGKRLKVLYQWHGQCLEAQARPVWTDAGGRHVIAFLLLSEKGVKTSLTDEFGLIANGRFTPLPKLVTGITGNVLDQGGLAF
jgi:hypothetical protein